MKKFTIIYTFKDSRMGFNNSITMEAQNQDQAIEKAKKEVAQCYGSQMFKKFSFKPQTN